MELVHYGSHFDIAKFSPPKNTNCCLNKPQGGFWSSPLVSRYGWIDFLQENNYNIPEICTTFCVNEEDMYIIRDIDDLKLISTIKTSYGYFIDFEKLAEKYKALYLTFSAMISTKFTSPSTCAWDCETVLILNPTCMYNIQFQ